MNIDVYLFDREARRAIDRTHPLGRDVTIVCTDGVRLAGSLFEAQNARAAVVIASATGVRKHYYARFASFLRSAGFSVLTFDYRGIGGSKIGSAKDSSAAMHEWGELDLDAAIAWSIAHTGFSSVHVIGHSVGGQLVGLVPNPDRIASMVLVAAQSGDFRLWPAPARWRMAAIFYGVVPSVTRAIGYFPGVLGIGEDLPRGVALEWARWCRTPGYVGRRGFRRVRAPLLAFGFDDDPYAPPAAVSALLDLYESSPQKRRQISRTRVGHFGFFRDRFRNTLWREVQRWLSDENAHTTTAISRTH